MIRKHLHRLQYRTRRLLKRLVDLKHHTYYYEYGPLPKYNGGTKMKYNFDDILMQKSPKNVTRWLRYLMSTLGDFDIFQFSNKDNSHTGKYMKIKTIQKHSLLAKSYFGELS